MQVLWKTWAMRHCIYPWFGWERERLSSCNSNNTRRRGTARARLTGTAEGGRGGAGKARMHVLMVRIGKLAGQSHAGDVECRYVPLLRPPNRNVTQQQLWLIFGSCPRRPLPLSSDTSMHRSLQVDDGRSPSTAPNDPAVPIALVTLIDCDALTG